MAASVGGLGRVGLFLLRGLGTSGLGAGGVVSGLDPQGTAQLMVFVRGGPTPYGSDALDLVGSLNYLAGTVGVGHVGALSLLGAASDEVVGAVNELAGTVGLEHGEAMRQWALSGNY